MQFLTVGETAERLRVSSETVRQLCDAQIITAIRISTKPNGHRKIVAESVDAYIEREVKKAMPESEPFTIVRPEYDPDTPRLDDVIKRARLAVKQRKAT